MTLGAAVTIIVGLIITLGCLLGGFVAMGGHVYVIWQPWEYVIICGSALGTFVVANPMKTIKDSGKGIVEAFKHDVPKKREYLDVLGLLYTLMRELRSKPRNEVEAHFDDPGQSPIFQKFPSVVKNSELLTFICDYCRLVTYSYTRSTDNAPGARYLDPFALALDEGPSNGERRHAIVASGSVLLPADVNIGLVWTWRSQLPWTATAGRDLNGDGFNTDLVPGVTRNSGSRDLDLQAVNAWRALNGRSAIDDSQIDSSRINIVDMRVSKAFRFTSTMRIDVLAQVFNLFNVRNLQSQYGGGRSNNALADTFGRILTARPATQGEVGLRFTW